MKCNKCGTDNNIENNFCINCGNRLDKNEHSGEIICESCGAVNELTNNYCTSCGENLKSPSSKNLEESSANQQLRYNKPHKKKKSKHYNIVNSQTRLTGQKHLPEKKLNFKPLLVSIVIFIISYLVYVIIDSQLDKKNLYEQKVFEVKSSNPAVEAEVYEIASKFACSCGTCGEESLEKCTCPKAIEERQFIRDYVETNQKREDILLAVANKYGFLKSQYASEVKGIDKSKIFESKLIIKPDNVGLNNNISLDKIAAVSDKDAIYLQFNCPCGKCTIDELKDCNCSHPNGAKEVKRFIDEKISENRYTVNQIIELVNSKYGGKKI